MSMVVFGVIGVTRTTGTTLEHQIVGWLTTLGSLYRIYNDPTFGPNMGPFMDPCLAQMRP